MTRTTRLLSAFITAGLLIVWSVLFGSGTATAQSITNTAQASWTISGQSFAARSNTVTFAVSPLPVSHWIELLDEILSRGDAPHPA